jgi:hypothetical protein
MKAKINIKFLTILEKKVDRPSPQLRIETDKTIGKLCETIEKYFLDHKIIVRTEYEIE